MSKSAIDLLRLVTGYQVSQAIHVAAVLGIADHLKDGPRKADTLAELTGSDASALYRLLRALAAAGVFREGNDRHFSLTPMGQCLRSDAETPVAPIAINTGQPYLWQTWGHLLYSVRTGQNAFQDLHGETVWQHRIKHREKSEIFNRFMNAMSRGVVEALVETYDFSAFRHVADIGGGQGELLGGVLAAHPHMLGTLFDQPHVVAGASAVLERSGASGRCKVVGGNFFETVPEGADAYLLKFIIHDWNDAEAIAILKVCRRAMAATAKLLLFEYVIGPPNEAPPAKFMDLQMLLIPGGLERTREEYAKLCAAADLELTRVVPAAAQFCVIEARPA